MPLKHCLLGSVFALLLATPVYAVPLCTPTSALAPFDYPGAQVIPTNNNLLLPAGKSIPADGQPLTLRGRVLDSECKPVSEAMVELWQTGPFGRWMVANREDLAAQRPVFAGAGRTYTDQNGYFTFFTAFPAPLRYLAPNINIRVKPQGLKEYRSALFFENDERNTNEPVFRKLKDKNRTDISIHVEPGEGDALDSEVTIVLSGKAPYRTY